MRAETLPRVGAALGLLGVCAAFPALANASSTTTIGLTGGAPQQAGGQQKVYDAGVHIMSWAGNQTPVNPLIAGLQLRVGLKTGLQLPVLNASVWATQDEPWLNHVDPSFTQQQVDVIHAAGAQAITNQGWSMDTRQWPTAAQLAVYPGDILSDDSYPTLAHPYAEIGAKTALLVKAAAGRPVWAALQVCSRSNFATGRVPMAAAEWEMAKRALHAGAKGIMFFGGHYKRCFQTAHDIASGFNWSAWNSTVLPTIHRIQEWPA